MNLWCLLFGHNWIHRSYFKYNNDNKKLVEGWLFVQICDRCNKIFVDWTEFDIITGRVIDYWEYKG